jgi:DNA-binding GntR family transcriptional regulator
MGSIISIKRVESLREQVADAVLQMIHTDQLRPGMRVTEQGLAESLKVSRTPIREALGRLAERGVFQIRPGGGYEVPKFAVKEVQDMIALRMLIEPPALRMAALEFGKDEIASIDRVIDDEDGLMASSNVSDLHQEYLSFRKSIFGPISNAALSAVITQYNPHIDFIRATTLKDIPLRKEFMNRQRQIRDAISIGDPDMAEAHWKSYLRLTEDILVNAILAWEKMEGDQA